MNLIGNHHTGWLFPSAYRVLLANPITPNETNIRELNRTIRASDFFQKRNAPTQKAQHLYHFDRDIVESVKTN
jgi:hypothetical protein